MTYRIGVDIGGTFTDFALFNDENGKVLTHKQLTTPKDPALSVIEGVGILCANGNILPADVETVVHGTTLVTNAVIERRGVPTAMVVTKGFADVLDIALERRYDLFDLRIRFPQAMVPRHLRFEVDERLASDGSIVKEPSLDGLERAISLAMETDRIEAIAVCFLHSYIDPSNERMVAEWLRERFPSLKICGSSEVFPFMREYERWTTACMNAYVQPVVDRYIARLESGLADLGFKGRFLIMSSSGSTLTADIARRYPVRMLESGPAAGALMAAQHGRALELPQILSFDMGGTTAKGCIVQGGEPLKRYEMEVARVHEFKKGSGLPVKIPVLDMIEIGSGGGSLAEVDERGTLRVGPRSASADPGPACYGRGGERPTLTDANLVLGYLDSSSFLGGRMQLDLEASKRVIKHVVADPLGVSLERAAWGIHEVINEDVARAFRVHASERGVDYRRCAMVAFGGSGPLHAARVARKLKIPKLICPWGAGVMSAFGLLRSPIGFELVKSERVALSALNATLFAERLNQLAAEAAGFLASAGVTQGNMRRQFRLDMRYDGQGHEIEVALPTGEESALIDQLPRLFAAAYAAVFGQSFDDRPVEIVAWKVEAQGPTPGEGIHYSLDGVAQKTPQAKGMREIYQPEIGQTRMAHVYNRYALDPGMQITGPALIEERESTCVLGVGDIGSIDAHGNLVIELGDLQ